MKKVISTLLVGATLALPLNIALCSAEENSPTMECICDETGECTCHTKEEPNATEMECVCDETGRCTCHTKEEPNAAEMECVCDETGRCTCHAKEEPNEEVPKEAPSTEEREPNSETLEEEKGVSEKSQQDLTAAEKRSSGVQDEITEQKKVSTDGSKNVDWVKCKALIRKLQVPLAIMSIGFQCFDYVLWKKEQNFASDDNRSSIGEYLKDVIRNHWPACVVGAVAGSVVGFCNSKERRGSSD